VFDIGSSLREARLRQELDFPALEERTKIRPKYLRALEDERFDILPAPTYVKGFLRSYAEALGLDGQPFVDEYNSRFAVGEDELVVRATRRVAAPRRDRQVRESRMAVVALVAIAVLTALVIAAWKFGGPEEQAVPGLAPQSATGGVAQAPAQLAFAVRAREGASWMMVRAGSENGRLLYSGTLERGQRWAPERSFRGNRLWLTLTRPDNVVVRLRGAAQELPSGSSFVVTARQIAPASSS
jgi:hypothetical protein